MVQAKRWQRAPSSATSTFPQAGQKSSMAAAAEGDSEGLAHEGAMELWQAGLARLVRDPLLCDLPAQVGRGRGGGGLCGCRSSGRPMTGVLPSFLPAPSAQVTPEEIASQVALEYGQAMTVRVRRADAPQEPMRESAAAGLSMRGGREAAWAVWRGGRGLRGPA